MPKHYGSSRYEGSNTDKAKYMSTMMIPVTGAAKMTHSGTTAAERGVGIRGYPSGRGPMTGKVDDGMVDHSNARAGKRYQQRAAKYY